MKAEGIPVWIISHRNVYLSESRSVARQESRHTGGGATPTTGATIGMSMDDALAMNETQNKLRQHHAERIVGQSVQFIDGENPTMSAYTVTEDGRLHWLFFRKPVASGMVLEIKTITEEPAAANLEEPLPEVHERVAMWMVPQMIPPTDGTPPMDAHVRSGSASSTQSPSSV